MPREVLLRFHRRLFREVEHRGRGDRRRVPVAQHVDHVLERAGATKDAAKRKVELASAKTILAEYIGFVKSEPLIEHIDKNPFGVNAQVRKVITDSLTHMIKSIA